MSPPAGMPRRDTLPRRERRPVSAREPSAFPMRERPHPSAAVSLRLRPGRSFIDASAIISGGIPARAATYMLSEKFYCTINRTDLPRVLPPTIAEVRAAAVRSGGMGDLEREFSSRSYRDEGHSGRGSHSEASYGCARPERVGGEDTGGAGLLKNFVEKNKKITDAAE